MHDPPPLTTKPHRSCLLGSSTDSSSNVKTGSDTSAAAAAAAAVPAATPVAASPMNRHVTVMHRESLPAYSTERYFLLSEIEVKAHSTRFLCDMPPVLHTESNNNDVDNSTVATGDVTDEDDDYERTTHARPFTATTSVDDQHDAPCPDEVPPFVLLYLLWAQPVVTTTTTAEEAAEYIQNVILPAVERLANYRRSIAIVNSLQEEHKAVHSNNKDEQRLKGTLSSDTDTEPAPPTEPDATSAANVPLDFEHTASSTQPKHPMSIYVLVDRLAIAPDDDLNNINNSKEKDESFLQQQEQLCQELARQVATHEPLCRLCEGITVGLADHVRAAPALEAIHDATAFGARDRRILKPTASKNLPQSLTNGRSLLAVVAQDAASLLGLQNQHETEAAQNVVQARWSAEWKGLGTLSSYSERAHTQWKRRVGVQLVAAANKQLGGAPKRKMVTAAANALPVLDEWLVNQLAIGLILLYMCFHLHTKSPELFWFLDPDEWVEAIQRLRR